MSESKKKVTGIGGIFFKCENPENMRNWYQENLGLVTNEYGSLFEFRNGRDAKIREQGEHCLEITSEKPRPKQGQ